jgi:pseudouridine-5'-phosphate glycosidase
VTTAPRIRAEVDAALRNGRPVVALETAVLTHGLPRTPRPAPRCLAALAPDFAWDERGPANVELSRALEHVVRSAGAVPATVSVLAGTASVGLGDAELERLGSSNRAEKISARDLPFAQVAGSDGGTTVAGTLAILERANAVAPAPIRVFATGAIGGVHRGWSERWDVSADLLAIARTPVCVLSAGAKSILDLDATVEMLDTLGVPVVGYGTDWFPRFLTAGAPPLSVQRRLDAIDDIAMACALRWAAGEGGVLLANPPPSEFSLAIEEVESAIVAGVEAARRDGVSGPQVTPYLLSWLAERTGGRSVEANIAALLANASLGARLATALTRHADA